MTLTLRSYQQAAIGSIYTYFERHTGNPLVVMPTASGKSIVIAEFVRRALEAWSDQRILIVTHVRELIAQNHTELIALWPEAPAGVYSAGFGRRDTHTRIIFCGIQSVYKRAASFGPVDLVLVDEAHLIPRASGTMYRAFLSDLASINAKLKVIGLTATPYRLDSGLLHEGEDRLFTHIAFDVSVRQLIDDGWLAPLISKAGKTELDVSGVGTRAGDFIAKELEAAVDLPDVTRRAVDEVAQRGADRSSWLLFCAGVDHAMHVAEAVRTHSFSCATIFGHTPKSERDQIITAFKRGEIRALASMNVLTTGFNAPAVDLIAMLRPTQSPGLYVQMAGRGTRLAPGKENCLVLDFAGNVLRHGPIDAVMPKRPGTGEGEPPMKVCPECQTILPAATRVCPDCDHVFPSPVPKIAPVATTAPILRQSAPQWVPVGGISYRRHDKPDKPPSLRVVYASGLLSYSEWICLEHVGYAREKAVAWWLHRGRLPIPATITEALARASELRVPVRIQLVPDGRFTRIIGHELAEDPDALRRSCR